MAFDRNRATQRVATTVAQAQQGATRYAGISAAQPRPPIPRDGFYRFQVLSCAEGRNPGKGTESYKISLQIVEMDDVAASKSDVTQITHKVGDAVFIPERIGGNGSSMGVQRVKAFVMAASGFDDEAAYNAFDPQGYFIEACAGKSNDYTAKGHSIVGRYVDCLVTRGNLMGSGPDYFREYTWMPVPDDEQPK